MRKTIRREVARCPHCELSILLDYGYTWCSRCGERLPEEIQRELPQLDGLRAVLANKATGDPNPPNTPAKPSTDPISTTSMIWKLRERAGKLITVAGFIMAGIIFLVMIGIMIFLNAGYTAQQEASPVASDALKKMTDITRSLQSISQAMDKAGKLPAGMSPNELKIALSKTEETVNQNVSLVRQDLRDNGQLVPVLVSSVSQRIGIIVLLIFLLQILVPTYRYNQRLAAYYSARADALEIVAQLPENNLESLIPILSPDAVDFGRTIKSPTDHALNVVKEAMKVGRRSPIQ